MAILSKPQSALAALSAWTAGVQQQVAPLAAQAADAATLAFAYAQAVLDRYPPLKIFLITLAAFSAIPVGIFLGFAITSGSIVFGVAGTGIAVVQGTLTAAAGFVLFWFLLGALFLSGLATFWLSTAYFGYKVVNKSA